MNSAPYTNPLPSQYATYLPFPVGETFLSALIITLIGERPHHTQQTHTLPLNILMFLILLISDGVQKANVESRKQM